MRVAHQIERIHVGALHQQQLDSLQMAVVRAADQRRLLHLRRCGTASGKTRRPGCHILACLTCHMSCQNGNYRIENYQCTMSRVPSPKEREQRAPLEPHQRAQDDKQGTHTHCFCQH